MQCTRWRMPPFQKLCHIYDLYLHKIWWTPYSNCNKWREHYYDVKNIFNDWYSRWQICICMPLTTLQKLSIHVIAPTPTKMHGFEKLEHDQRQNGGCHPQSGISKILQAIFSLLNQFCPICRKCHKMRHQLCIVLKNTSLRTPNDIKSKWLSHSWLSHFFTKLQGNI